MPAFLVPILTWLANWVMTYLAGSIATAIKNHEQAVAQSNAEDAANAAALAKLQAAKSKAEKIDAIKAILNGL